jgi:glycosyltransferase involved in cell wall biosynthesis
MAASAPAGTVAIVVKGYPRLSETFIAQEIHALQQLGLPLRLYSLRRPTETAVHPIHREITASVTYLPEYLHDEPQRVLAAWRRARHLPGYGDAWRVFRRDLARERSRNRLRRFGQACVLASELPADVTRLYAHFLHTPASVTRYAALMTGLPWCASAHAKDIWTTPEWEKREKLADADWVVTCSAAGRDHLASLAPDPDKISLAYHGLDFARFPHPTPARPARNGTDPADPVLLLSVGRAVEKKGYDDLLDALVRLPARVHWRLAHIGGGEQAQDLAARADVLGLGARIDWLGAQPQERVLAEYRRADLFVLASRVARDGDRDGLPNVLMEAQSQALPCISTCVSAIPELIENEATGLLVPPGDPAALAAALHRLMGDPRTRARLGDAGCRRVRAHFSVHAGIDTLARRFGLAVSAVAAQ